MNMHHNGMAASGAGWVLHDLGLAAAFGGSLFGKLAMNPAVRSIHSEEERSLVLTKAWTGYNIVNAASLATAAATWVVGRTMLSGREVSFMTRPLVIAKDVLLGVTVGTGVANIIADIVKAKTEPAAPMQSGEKPSQRTPETTRKLQTVWKVLGTVNLISMAGVIGVTAVLATQSAKSVRWGLLSRFLP
jgi:hypothetical protein